MAQFNYGYKSNWCRCTTCMLFDYSSWKDDYQSLPRDRDCEMCNEQNRPICRYVPQEVREFLKVERVCYFCRNKINHYVKKKFRLCWATASYPALKLAMLQMLEDQLATLCFHPIWEKTYKGKTRVNGKLVNV